MDSAVMPSNLLERQTNLKVKFNWYQQLQSSSNYNYKTPLFSLNFDRSILCSVTLIHEILNDHKLSCRMQLNTKLILDSVSILFVTSNGSDDFFFKLIKDSYSANSYISEKKIVIYKTYCNNCSRNISISNQITIQEIIVTYSIIDDPAKKCLNLFKSLYTTKEYSDMTITVEESKFKVHKIVLASNSEVLKNMIDSDMSEKKTNNINFPDVDINIFKEILKFMYTGACDVSKTPHEIFKFAHLYQISFLQSDCERYLLSNINFNNIIDTIKLVELYDLTEIQKAITNFVTKNEDLLAENLDYIKYYKENMKPQNAHYIYALAVKYNLNDILESLKEYIKNNLEKVLADVNFKDLIMKNPEYSYDILNYLSKTKK